MNAFLETIWKNVLEGKAWQVKEEFLQLLQFCLDNKVHRVLEIGTHKGGSALGFLAIGCDVVSIDVVKHPEVEALEKEYFKEFKFYLRDERENQPDEDQGYFDLLFVDGDHSYTECLKDVIDHIHLIKGNGFIAFHDVLNNELHKKNDCEVWRAIESLMELLNIKWRQDFITDGTWGGISVLKSC